MCTITYTHLYVYIVHALWDVLLALYTYTSVWLSKSDVYKITCNFILMEVKWMKWVKYEWKFWFIQWKMLHSWHHCMELRIYYIVNSMVMWYACWLHIAHCNHPCDYSSEDSSLLCKNHQNSAWLYCSNTFFT